MPKKRNKIVSIIKIEKQICMGNYRIRIAKWLYEILINTEHYSVSGGELK